MVREKYRQSQRRKKYEFTAKATASRINEIKKPAVGRRLDNKEGSRLGCI